MVILSKENFYEIGKHMKIGQSIPSLIPFLRQVFK